MSKRPGVAVTNLSTSRMLDDIAAQHGGRVIRTPVGEANVVDAMLKADGGKGAVVGGEGNGGVIDLRIVPGRDSLVGMAYVLQLMAAANKSVSELVAEIPRYEIVKTKFECRREDADRAVAAVKAAFAGGGSDAAGDAKIDTQDGIRIDWPDAWVHARPSNTEPIMRIIAEAPTKAAAEARIASVQDIVKRVL
jgi:phosphomannomutase